MSNSNYSKSKSTYTKKNGVRSDQILPQKPTTTGITTRISKSVCSKSKNKLNPKTESKNQLYNEKYTPRRKEIDLPRRKLFETEEPENEDIDIVPDEVNWEVLLINSLVINTIKVQTIIEKFIRNKEYTSIFCMTETKVDSHDFKPEGVKIFSKHRTKKDKKGGGLTIGYKIGKKIKMEEIKVKNNDVLAIEGTIGSEKIRLILCYFDSTKLKKGVDFQRNRRIQKEIEKLIEVDPGTKLICLGDFNGRISRIEPNIVTDANGKMLENWVEEYDLHHLNLSDRCTGKYTFHSPNGKSAIDHVLINNELAANFIGMHIDEDRTMLSISDHSLVRVWFRLKNDIYPVKWNQKKYKTITWISKEESRMEDFKANFIPKIGKNISFKKCIDKMKNSLNSTMKRRKRIKIGIKKNEKLLAAEWVDDEFIGNVKLRSKYSR